MSGLLLGDIVPSSANCGGRFRGVNGVHGHN